VKLISTPQVPQLDSYTSRTWSLHDRFRRAYIDVVLSPSDSQCLGNIDNIGLFVTKTTTGIQSTQFYWWNLRFWVFSGITRSWRANTLAEFFSGDIIQQPDVCLVQLYQMHMWWLSPEYRVVTLSCSEQFAVCALRTMNWSCIIQ
jgi:hypothetical protein